MAKPVIGIIGSIGAGKSTVASLLAQRGGFLVNADGLGHEGLRQSAIKAEAVARWGATILKDDGEIDRRKLGAIVFANDSDLKALQAMQFPFITRRVREEIAKAELDSAVKFVILDAAVLLEANWKSACDRLVFVDAPRTVRLERVRKNRGWSDAELSRREASQLPLDEKRRMCDDIVENGQGVAELERAVELLVASWSL